MKIPVMAMKRVVTPTGTLTDVFGDKVKLNIDLPDGCIGIVMCFESKKAAREYWGKDIDLVEILMEEL